VVQASDIFARELKVIPKTCRQWIEVYMRVVAQTAPIQAPGLKDPSAYTFAWSFRTWAIARMRHAGVQALQGTHAVSIDEFASAFPDQNSWFHTWQQKHKWDHYNSHRRAQGPKTPSCPALTLKGLFQLIHYTGPPEEASMVMCLLGDEGLNDVPANFFTSYAKELAAESALHKKQHSISPHITVAVRLVMDKIASEDQGPPAAKRAKKL
jgi:hypothetical protein